MKTNENNQNGGDTGNAGEGENGSVVETVTIPKTEWETANQTLGSLKRQVKDLTKSKDEPIVTPKETKPDDTALLQKLERISLRQAGLSHQDDIELARNIAKKWGMDIDEVLTDEDFKAKLERQQTARNNTVAVSNIRGGGGITNQDKNTPEYWMTKGTPPTATDIPDAKVRRPIVRAFVRQISAGGGTKFYNE